MLPNYAMMLPSTLCCGNALASLSLVLGLHDMINNSLMIEKSASYIASIMINSNRYGSNMSSADALIAFVPGLIGVM